MHRATRHRAGRYADGGGGEGANAELKGSWAETGTAGTYSATTREDGRNRSEGQPETGQRDGGDANPYAIRRAVTTATLTADNTTYVAAPPHPDGDTEGCTGQPGTGPGRYADGGDGEGGECRLKALGRKPARQAPTARPTPRRRPEPV
ncbi:hypothetical protein [Serratia odorifera]|uniref:hypothetical protein n=1 Tax=Serratia odorifera TaxID=618 RepID=UPI000FD7C4CB|nr:hypothetical protein [Serratia odorifera]